MHIGTFAGRLGQDAEIKELSSGKSLTKFPLAVDVGWGENKETMWVDGEVWGERGLKLAPILVKGKQVTITGRIKVRAYTSKAGEPKAAISCDVQELTPQGGGERRSSEPVTPKVEELKAPADTDPFHSDDIPF